MTNFDALGLPRPIVDRMPVPWTQDRDNWGRIDTDKQVDCTAHSLCLVCGEHVQRGKVFGSIFNIGHARASLDAIPLTVTYEDLPQQWVSDAGPIHDRCAKLTYAHCAHIKMEVDTGETFILNYIDTRFELL